MTRGTPRRLAVAAFPTLIGINPYQRLLHAALEDRDVTVETDQSFTAEWVRGARGRVDLVHLHWIEHIVGDPGRGPLRIPRVLVRFARFIRAFLACKRAGIRVVWTIHNLRPHERRVERLDDRLGRLVFDAADGIIVHSEFARHRVEAQFGRSDRIAVIPHGNYDGAYPPERRSREAVRAALNLPADAFMYLSFGLVRPYKQMDAAIRAFRQLSDPGVCMVVAGRPLRPEFAAPLVEAAAGDDRVILRLEPVHESKVAAYHRAADAAIFAYPEVFSSGALLLALTQGLPVVAPDDSAATETAKPPAIEAFRPGGLIHALRAVRTGDHAARSRAALQIAEAHSWQRVAERTLSVYREALRRPSDGAAPTSGETP